MAWLKISGVVANELVAEGFVNIVIKLEMFQLLFVETDGFRDLGPGGTGSMG
jgi:hypothetical protein